MLTKSLIKSFWSNQQIKESSRIVIFTKDQQQTNYKFVKNDEYSECLPKVWFNQKSKHGQK